MALASLARRSVALRRRQCSAAVLARYASSSSSDAVKEAESSANASASDVTDSKAASASAETPAEVGLYEEVKYSPRRVMPLPEDRPNVVEVEVPGDGSTPPRKVFKRVFRPAPAFDFDIPLPKMVPQEERKKMDPVGLAEAIRLVKSNAKARFVETVEAHIRLGIDPKRSDQTVRGAVTLPHGSGKVVRVAVFADGTAAEEALGAGADVVGSDDLVAKILSSGGKLDFEKCIATPSMMPKLGKVARILGSRGLMPNPKVGTVTSSVGEAVRAIKRGRVDFRTDKFAIVHAGLGKVNFSEEALYENVSAFAGAVLAAKPAGLKKSSRYFGFFDKFHLTSTMGGGIPVTIQSIAIAADEYMKAHDAL